MKNKKGWDVWSLSAPVVLNGPDQPHPWPWVHNPHLTLPPIIPKCQALFWALSGGSEYHVAALTSGTCAKLGYICSCCSLSCFVFLSSKIYPHVNARDKLFPGVKWLNSRTEMTVPGKIEKRLRSCFNITLLLLAVCINNFGFPLLLKVWSFCLKKNQLFIALKTREYFSRTLSYIGPLFYRLFYFT